MKNVALKVAGNTLTITVDLKKRQGVSKSGKSEVIASTEGNVTPPGMPHIKIGLNVYTPNNHKEG